MKRLVVGMAILAAVVLALWSTTRRGHPEPTFQGRPVREWALDLNSPSAETRHEASAVIARFDASEVPTLVRLLHTPDPVLARPISAVASRVPKRVGAGLYRIVNPFEARAQRAAAAQAFRIMGPRAETALPELRKALAAETTVAWHAALALAQLGQPGIDALAGALSTTPPLQRGFVCYALGSQGPSASNAVPALGEVLRSSDTQVVEKAATALAGIGKPAVSELTQALTNSALPVRLLSVGALGNIGPPARPALPLLLDLARTDAPPARAAAVDALGRVQGRSELVLSALAAALEDPARPVRLKALEALGRSGAPLERIIPALLPRLRDESPEIRSQTAALLGKLKSAREQILPALRAAAQDENVVVRERVREALTALETREPQ